MGKVLVVEDNDLNMELFHDLLTIQGHEIIISTDGINVKEIVIREKPNLILLDIQLNGISGIDIMQSLKGDKQTRHIPIIAITAFAMKQDEVRITNAGCDLYLTKPVSIDNFYQSVTMFIDNSTDNK
jgi:two-component system cell cycle response regulator DivK